MFGIMRRKSRRKLVRQELMQSAEHFKQAATHAARGTGAHVGPKLNAARDRVQPTAGRVMDVASSSWGSTVAVLAPLAAAATDGARQAGRQGRKAQAKNAKQLQKKAGMLQKRANKTLSRKKAKPRVGKLAGLLVAGAAVGAGAAYVLRRRDRQQWDAYDPSRPMGATEQARAEAMMPTGGTMPGDAANESAQPYGDPGLTVGNENRDQTASALHSPTVARMAAGKDI